jgi:uncharacterized protein (TIGR04222 family)
MNPFDWTGGHFLGLYGLFLVEAIAAGLLIPNWLRPAGREGQRIDADALAWLAGGRARVADSVVAGLLARGALIMIGKDRFGPAPGARGKSPVEQSVLSIGDVLAWPKIEERVRPYTLPLRDRLRGMGLVMDADALASVRFWSTLPYVLLIGFGAIKLLVGEARERPVGYLTALLVATLVLAVIRWASVDQRTRAGRRLVADEKRVRARLKRAPMNDEVRLAVALFGTGVLAGSAWAGFHQLRSASDGGSSGGGDTGSGGSGCGGGGCGGCGG